MLETLLHSDAALLDWVITLPHPRWLNILMVAATLAGRGAAIWFALGIVRVLAKRGCGAAFFRMVLVLVLTIVLVELLFKPLVARPRPPLLARDAQVLVGLPATFSFPSGHAATAVAGAFALSCFWRSAGPSLWLLAALIAVSRVYLGVHYPLDVLGGALVGLTTAVLVTGGARQEEDPPHLATVRQ